MPRDPGADLRVDRGARARSAKAMLLCRRNIVRLILLTVHWVCCAAAWSFDAERLLEASARQGSRAQTGARALVQLVQRLGTEDEVQRVRLVNQFFNQRIEFKEDLETWGKADNWASPLESMGKGSGDCEDYAIAKYFSLVAAGVPEAKLRMVYVRAVVQGRSLAHMVLAYYAQAQAEPLILDNLVEEVRPASARLDLSPVFSFNTEGLWQGVGSSSAGNPIARLSQWRDVVARVKAEGF